MNKDHDETEVGTDFPGSNRSRVSWNSRVLMAKGTESVDTRGDLYDTVEQTFGGKSRTGRKWYG